MNVLIVDDDDDIRDVLGVILRATGYQVDEAADGVEAIERLRRHPPPDLILLDMMMPRLDGEGVIAAMRCHPMLERVPIVVLSGHPSVRERAERLGVMGCLVKPIELSELMSTVQRVATDSPTTHPHGP